MSREIFQFKCPVQGCQLNSSRTFCLAPTAQKTRKNKKQKTKQKKKLCCLTCVRLLILYLLDMEGDKKMQTKNDGVSSPHMTPIRFPRKLTTDDDAADEPKHTKKEGPPEKPQPQKRSWVHPQKKAISTSMLMMRRRTEKTRKSSIIIITIAYIHTQRINVCACEEGRKIMRVPPFFLSSRKKKILVEREKKELTEIPFLAHSEEGRL